MGIRPIICNCSSKTVQKERRAMERKREERKSSGSSKGEVYNPRGGTASSRREEMGDRII